MKKIVAVSALAVLIFSSCQKNSSSVNNTPAQTTAGFKVTNTGGEVNEGSALSLSNTSTNAVSYLWTFGNGKSSVAKEPNYTYPHCGVYTVTLTVTDAQGHTETTSQELIVNCIFANPNHPSLY